MQTLAVALAAVARPVTLRVARRPGRDRVHPDSAKVGRPAGMTDPSHPDGAKERKRAGAVAMYRPAFTHVEPLSSARAAVTERASYR